MGLSIPREQIAIDGLSCTGKSTTARLLARELEYGYLSAGEFYRSYAASIRHMREDSREKVIDALREMSVEVDTDTFHVLVNGQDFYDELRTAENTKFVGDLCKYEDFLKVGLEKIQPALVDEVVMDGRNIGADIMPNAKLKCFLEADMNIRVERKAGELRTSDFLAVQKSLEENDSEELSRRTSPLKKVSNAKVVDTSRMTPNEVVQEILKFV